MKLAQEDLAGLIDADDLRLRLTALTAASDGDGSDMKDPVGGAGGAEDQRSGTPGPGSRKSSTRTAADWSAQRACPMSRTN